MAFHPATAKRDRTTSRIQGVLFTLRLSDSFEANVVNVQIRHLESKDWMKYRAIRLEALRCDPQAFSTTLESMESKPDEYWPKRLESANADPKTPMLFAISEGKPVGMVAAVRTETPGVALLISMYVSQEVRGLGIGRELVKSLLAALRKTGEVQRVQLEVSATQAAAIRLYRSAGFVETGRKEILGVEGDSPTQIEMEQVLGS